MLDYDKARGRFRHRFVGSAPPHFRSGNLTCSNEMATLQESELYSGIPIVEKLQKSPAMSSAAAFKVQNRQHVLRWYLGTRRAVHTIHWNF